MCAARFSRLPIGPHIRAAPAASPAVKSRLQIGQANVIGPSVAADRSPMRATIVGAIDEQAYPEVEVEIAASEELVDLAVQGFDAGIRLGQFIAADMVAVRLTQPFPFVVVGSPDYLRQRKRPESIDDLRQHACRPLTG